MISHAIQKGRFVVAYNSQNHRIFEKCGELISYTNETVTIRQHGDDRTTTYNTQGHSVAQFRISRDESNDEPVEREVSGEGGCGIMLLCLFLAFLAAILGCILK